MKFLKSHFWYHKRQRNGILFLLLMIAVFQLVISFVSFSSEEAIDIEASEIRDFQHQIDSLKIIELEKRKPKIYLFNPNYITDYKGYQLGLSVDEIDRLHTFRDRNKFVNSAKQFQQVTKVSDSLLQKIAPYFKFPDWVIDRTKNVTSSLPVRQTGAVEKSRFKKKTPISTSNLNKATAEDLQTIRGIGKYFSEKIINYRDRLQGFSFESQLYEVWKLDKEVADRVLKVFAITEKPILKKTNVNTATFKEVLKNPYIDYELCKKIFEYRDEVAEIQRIEELKNIAGFPKEKYERIILYLEAK